jgi:chitin synthase
MGRPLEEYFHGDPTLAKILGKKAASASLYRLNRFSTDNRVLPFEIVAKHGSNWHTRCVPAAVAETDVPTSVVDFIHQRRRWLNGSLAASTYNLRRSHRLISSGHTIPRMALISIQILHNLIAFVLAWFSLAGLLLTTFIVNDITGDPPDGIQVDGFPFGRSTPIINSIIQIIYLATIAVQFLVALGSRPRSHVLTYRISFSIFAVVQLYLFVNLIYLAKIIIDFKLDKIGSTNYAYISQYYTDIGDVTVLATAISFLGVYITAGFLCLDPWHLFHSWAQYLFVSSSYVNIVKTHAFSNFQDISWSHELGAEIVCVTPVSRGIQRIRDEAHEEIGPGPRNIDDEFEQTVKRALSPFKEKTIAAKGDPEEKFMNSRIKLVAVYVFSNFLLCLIVMNDSFRSLSWLGNSYWHRIWFFRIYLWANSGLLMLQFIGCVYQKAVGLFYCCVSQR